jgi:hypothetical protein
MEVTPDEELDRVTVSMLRHADERCPRRLQHEFTSGRKLSALSEASFDVTNRVVADITTWHRGQVDGDPERVAFPDPDDLEPEQRAFYRALVRGYLELFPPVAAEVGDCGWATDIAELDVRLVGPVGIPLVHTDGIHQLRMLRAGRGSTLLDDVDLRFALLRAAEWTRTTLQLVAFDPLELQSVEYDIDIAGRLEDAQAWLAARVALIRARGDKHDTRAGADCRFCTCIPGCPQIARTT